MRSLFGTIACSIFFFSTAAAADTDTAKTYHADEVVVTATRSNLRIQDSPSPVHVLDAEDMQRTNGSSVADVLRSSESVFLKDYGPTASLKTISFRGMPAEDILVLLDGTRLNNFQNGMVDFSLLPMNNVDHIEVVHGGSSALYGADALGGIINIISSRPSDTLQAHTDVSFGSFDYRRYSFDIRKRIQGLGIVFGVMHDQAAENYPYVFHRIGLPDTLQNRDGADFTRTQLYLNSDYSFDDRSEMALSIQRVKSNQGVPGSLKYVSAMRQDDDAVTTVVSFHDHHLTNFTFSLNTGWTYDLQQYYSQTKTTLVTLNPQVQWDAFSWDRLIVGGEFIEGNLEGMLPDALIKRIQRSLYFSNEILLQSASAGFDRLSLYQSVRYDALSEGEEAYSPKVGFNFRVVRDWETRLRGSYSRNFRMPTFNDLYDSWLGNPLLKPEHSECFDLGIESAFDRSGVHTLQLTYFRVDTRDRILPNSAFYPINVPHALSAGIEGRYDLRLPGNTVNAFADFTFNNSFRRSSDSTDGKQLLYMPETVCAFGISALVFGVHYNLSETYTSRRFTSEDESASLPVYWLTDFNVSTVVSINPVRINLRFEVSNAFDIDYQVLPYYPMPGRSFRVSAAIEY